MFHIISPSIGALPTVLPADIVNDECLTEMPDQAGSLPSKPCNPEHLRNPDTKHTLLPRNYSQPIQPKSDEDILYFSNIFPFFRILVGYRGFKSDPALPFWLIKFNSAKAKKHSVASIHNEFPWMISC
ncbi:MAG TPA: hypothetical protein VMJ32_01070 [Pirellulales bacterium]|nr:hypothetical protein [Pirellulales bacterium]